MRSEQATRDAGRKASLRAALVVSVQLMLQVRQLAMRLHDSITKFAIKVA